MQMQYAFRWFGLLALMFNAALADAAEPTFEKDVQPFLKTHCYTCHGPEKQESRIRYDQFEGYSIDQQHLWTSVHEMLSADAMPPEDQPQPADAEKQLVLRWIEQQSAAATAEQGVGSMRRLNRRELSAALQDLTGLQVAYADALPGDGKVAGFDTGAAGLQDAADSVAQVMKVSRRAVEAVYFLEQPESVKFTGDLTQNKDIRKALDHWKEGGAQPKVRGMYLDGKGVLLETKWVGEKGGMEIYVPPPPDGRGVLRVKLVVAAYTPMKGVPNPHLWVEIGGKKVDYGEVTAPVDKPQTRVYEIQVEDVAAESKGIKIQLSGRVEIPYGVKGFENEDKTKPDSKIPGGPGLFRPVYDKKQKTPEGMPIPFVLLSQIEVDTDYVTAWPPAGWQAEVGEISDDAKSAGRLLALWMERAWRRPITNTERDHFLALYERLRGQRMSFDEALRATFQSVLLSAPFRYLASPSDENQVIAQHAVASRLSFMLVGGPPDAELRKLAADGKLRDPKVLDQQVDRLLDDPASNAFVRPFVYQWLVMDQPITITMDYFEKQDFRFARYLKQSMKEETIAYVAQLFQENRPASELIQSDWTMMNNALAIHYGYEGIEGAELRKVKLKKDDARGGGVLSHAGIQSMLTWMGENWVIYRGAWTLRHILDDPPPAPPLEVPELIPSDHKDKTFRELLKQHQEDSRCSVCHKSMDPMGFAFQNFDISGRWRDVEHEKYIRNELDGKIEWRGAGKTRPVDAVGQLPRGEEFTSFTEAKQEMVKHYTPDLVRGVLKNLMIYSTGRQPGVKEMAEIKQIIAAQQKDRFPMRDLVKAVVRSEAFLNN